MIGASTLSETFGSFSFALNINSNDVFTFTWLPHLQEITPALPPKNRTSADKLILPLAALRQLFEYLDHFLIRSHRILPLNLFHSPLEGTAGAT